MDKKNYFVPKLKYCITMEVKLDIIKYDNKEKMIDSFW